VKRRSIYVNLRPKWFSAHSTQIVGYILQMISWDTFHQRRRANFKTIFVCFKSFFSKQSSSKRSVTFQFCLEFHWIFSPVGTKFFDRDVFKSSLILGWKWWRLYHFVAGSLQRLYREQDVSLFAPLAFKEKRRAPCLCLVLILNSIQIADGRTS